MYVGGINDLNHWRGTRAAHSRVPWEPERKKNPERAVGPGWDLGALREDGCSGSGEAFPPGVSRGALWEQRPRRDPLSAQSQALVLAALGTRESSD